MRLAREEQFIPIGFVFLDSEYAKANEIGPFEIILYLHMRRFVRRSFDIPLADVRELVTNQVVSRVGREKLATRLGRSSDTVDRAITKLVEVGWVKKVQHSIGHALYYVLGDRIRGQEIFFAEEELRKFELPDGIDDEEVALRTADLQRGIRTGADTPSADLRTPPPQGRGAIIEKPEVEKGEQDTPDSLRSSEKVLHPSEEVQIPHESAVVETGDKQKSAHGGANTPSRIVSVPTSNREAEERRNERLWREGVVTPEGSMSRSSGGGSRGGNGGRGAEKRKKAPDPEVMEALALFAATYKQVFGAEFLSGAPQIAQMRSLVKRCSGKERALAICEFVLQKWPELSRRWKWFGHPDLGVILMRAQSVWNEIQTGKGGTSPTQTRDERTEQQQDARNRMYADKDAPIIGFEAFMGTKPASAAPGR